MLSELTTRLTALNIRYLKDTQPLLDTIHNLDTVSLISCLLLGLYKRTRHIHRHEGNGPKRSTRRHSPSLSRPR